MQEEAIDHHSSVSESESGHSNLYESDDSNADETINDFDQLPHFANDENKRLHAEIRQKTEYLLKLTQNVEDNKNRISIMLEHMKNVENELSHSRQIVSAKQNEIATEKQLSVLAEKERHRLNSETKRSEHEIMEHQNRINHVHNEIFEVTEKIESFKLRMNWKNEELQQWTLAAKQKEEDQLALERYKRADELKIKNLNIELESVSTEYKQVEKSLQTEIAETKAIQVELDNAASEFKSLHDDRVDVINKWDDSVKQIHHKDGQIIEVAKNVDALKQVVHEHDQEISRKKQALLAQVAEEKNMQRNIEKLTRELEKLRKDAMSFQQVVKHETNEVMLVQNELSKIDKESKMALFKIKSLAAMNEEYVKKLDAKKEKLQQKIGELQHAKKNLIDTEKETNDIDLLLSEHEAKLSAVLKVESSLKKDLFKQQSLLFDLKKQEQNLESEIKGSIATTRNLLSKIDEFDKRSLKQGEALYSLDFQIQQLERKVSRAAGKRTREEQIELNEKISALSNKLDMQKKHESDLSGQVKKFNDDLRNAKRVSVEMANKKQAVEAKINDVNLENEAIEQELAELDKEKNKLFLAHDEEKLHINKIRGQLAQITEKVFVLESQKIELAAVVAKELHEMQQINEINCIQLKNKQTILHSTKVEFTKCQQKINTLKARYSTLAGRTRPSNSEDGEGEQSQAYIMIKRAQTKQELQDRGNMLDAEIQKTERELKLLYKSLSHLNHGNDLYRQSLTESMASMPVLLSSTF